MWFEPAPGRRRTARLPADRVATDAPAPATRRAGNAFAAETDARTSDAGGERTTRLEDLALVCPTCHRALHSRSRWSSVQELHKHLH